MAFVFHLIFSSSLALLTPFASFLFLFSISLLSLTSLHSSSAFSPYLNQLLDSFVVTYQCILQEISECEKVSEEVSQALKKKHSHPIVCSAISRVDGIFVFPSVPSGEYTLVSSPMELLLIFNFIFKFIIYGGPISHIVVVVNLFTIYNIKVYNKKKYNLESTSIT